MNVLLEEHGTKVNSVYLLPHLYPEKLSQNEYLEF